MNILRRTFCFLGGLGWVAAGVDILPEIWESQTHIDIAMITTAFLMASAVCFLGSVE